MVEMPPPLPPGVYFIPTKEECLGFLNRSIASDSALPDARGCIFQANIYDEHPDVLRQRHPSASIREGEHTWWFLSETRFQNQTSRTKCADRRFEAVGCGWYRRLGAERAELQANGLKNCFSFYTGPDRSKDKTAWLMQEFTRAKDDGAGRRGVPALYRIYVTPHATADHLKDIYGEDDVEVKPDRKTKPARPKAPVRRNISTPSPSCCRRGASVLSAKSTLRCYRRRRQGASVLSAKSTLRRRWRIFLITPTASRGNILVSTNSSRGSIVVRTTTSSSMSRGWTFLVSTTSSRSHSPGSLHRSFRSAPTIHRIISACPWPNSWGCLLSSRRRRLRKNRIGDLWAI